MIRKIAVEIISFLFIVLFVYAALTKLADYKKFVVQVGQSPLLTDIASFVAWFIPAIEITIAVLLSFSRTRTAGMYGSFSLMVMFTAYIIAILNFSEHIPCSCGGVLETLGWTEHLVFNVVCIGLALTGIIFTTRKEVDGKVVSQR